MSRGVACRLFRSALLRRLPGAAVVLALVCGAGDARAQRALAPCPATVRVAAVQRWPAPLDRPVTLPVGRTTVRAALDAIGDAARLRLSYSPDLLAADRTVCATGGAQRAGDALLLVLDGTGLVPVPAGDDQVVLAPVAASAVNAATPASARPAHRLERIVVTGTAAGASERTTPFALDVLEPDASGRTGVQSLGQLLDGAVPGVWLWNQGPAGALARYGSVRGASSFGVSAPKIYLDGIEVANPLLVTQLDPARVQSVEIIRGPQGAALYGADAIDGVINIVTRHDDGGPDGARATLRASAGLSGSAWAAGNDVLAQDHALMLQIGRAARSASLGISASTLGAYVPGASARQLLGSGGARWVGTRAVATGTLRLFALDADAPASPLLASVLGDDSTASAQSVRQYTLGSTVTLYGSEHWTHSIVAGVDGYRLDGVPSDGLPVPSAADSALRAARGGADRLTLRLRSSRTLGEGGHIGSVSVGAEHSTVREHTNGQGIRLLGGEAEDSVAATGVARTTWWSNTGVLADGRVMVARALSLNGGARLEYSSSGVADDGVWSVLPMLGASWVRELSGATLKLRGAYGRGIRPARTVVRGATWMGRRDDDGAAAALGPESQAGVEFGADLFVGSRLALHATRFDQRVSGLVQPVTVLDTARGQSGGSRGDGLSEPGGDGEVRIGYLLQNVGAIDNRGWELQATTTAGPFSLAGTYTVVSSRVDRLAPGYGGDLLPGDRMLEVPASTFGASATVVRGRWSAGVSVARALDWINYDRLSLAQAAANSSGASGDDEHAPVGFRLREYWRRYDGPVRLGGRLSVGVWRDLSLTLTGDNLLGRQTGEPDNTTVIPGRTVTIGLTTRLR